MDIKDLAIGVASGMIRGIMTLVWGFFVDAHPAMANALSPINDPLFSQIIATFLGAFVIALGGAILRVLRHNKVFSEAFDAGSTSATIAIAQDRAAASALGKPTAGNISILLALVLSLASFASIAADIGGSSDQKIMRAIDQVRVQETALRQELDKPGHTTTERAALEKQADALCNEDTRLLILSMLPSTNTMHSATNHPGSAVSASATSASTSSGPRLYATAGIELEAHHGALAGASDYGSILHVGADYGLLGVEGVLTGPLDKSQTHVRRSAGVDLIVSPLSGYLLQPFISAGAGYYYGTTRYDTYATWAADIGGGLRLPISDHVFLQACGRVMLPFDTTSNVFQIGNRFQMVSLEMGARW